MMKRESHRRGSSWMLNHLRGMSDIRKRKNVNVKG